MWKLQSLLPLLLLVLGQQAAAKMELFYCADPNEAKGGYDYRFRLEKTGEGHDGLHLKLIMFGIKDGVFVDQSVPPDAQTLDEFEATTLPTQPFDDVVAHGNQYILSPLTEMWYPEAVGEALTWGGHAWNYIPEGGLYWTFTSSGDVPGKETYIPAVECPPADDATNPTPVPHQTSDTGGLDCSYETPCEEIPGEPTRYWVCIEEDGVMDDFCEENFYTPPGDLVLKVKHCGPCRL